MLRQAIKEDAEALAGLAGDLFPVHPWDDKQFLYEISENPFAVIYVEEDEEGIIGYIDLWVQYEQASVATFGVKRNDQGKGLGQQLLTRAVNEAMAAGCENISLEVRPTNTKAVRLYEKNGFITVAERSDYYADGEDALLMIKPIGGLKEYAHTGD